MNKPELARASFDIARKKLEKNLQETPDDYQVHSFLGIAYAGLGRKEQAIQEGKRAVDFIRFQRTPSGVPIMLRIWHSSTLWLVNRTLP
jgi:Flp pilus assembly protein TadD